MTRMHTRCVDDSAHFSRSCGKPLPNSLSPPMCDDVHIKKPVARFRFTYKLNSFRQFLLHSCKFEHAS